MLIEEVYNIRNEFNNETGNQTVVHFILEYGFMIELIKGPGAIGFRG